MDILLLSSLLCILMRLGAAQYTFTIRGSSSEAALGSPYSFTCEQSGALPGTPGVGLTFVKDENKTFCTAHRTQCSPSFPQGTSCGCVYSSGGTYTYRYNISSVGMEHSGSWICRIGTSTGNVDTSPCQLILLVHPIVTLVNSSQMNVVEGQPVTLTCEATGSPAPSFSWSRSETPVSSGSRSSLTFTPDRRDGNSQRVTCTASNSAGTDSASFSLNVQSEEESIHHSASTTLSTESSNAGPLVGGLVGGSAGLVVLVIVIVVIVVFQLKKKRRLERWDQTLSQASLHGKLADEEPRSAKNSSEGLVHPIFDDIHEPMDLHGPTANAGLEKKANKKQSSKERTGELYARVNKNPTGKADAYQNEPVKGGNSAGGVRVDLTAPQDNQERRSIHDGGCVYVKVDSMGKPNPPKIKKPRSPSQDDAVVYTVIDHTKKGPELADEADMTKK